MEKHKGVLSPLQLMAVLTGLIFSIEFLVMVFLERIAPLPDYISAFLDASLLLIFLFPFFYYLIFKRSGFSVQGNPGPNGGSRPSPFRALLIVCGAVFVNEVMMMFALSLLPPLPGFVEAILDSLVLLVMTSPFLYYYFFTPLITEMDRLKKTQESLRVAKESLEVKVEERTKELRATNIDLEQEIAERIHAEQTLRMEKEKAQSYLDTAEVIFLVLDAQGRVSMINKKGCSLLNCTEESITGIDWFATFVPPEEQERSLARFHALFADGKETRGDIEGSIVTRNGDRRTIGWHSAPIRGNDGKINAILFSGKDITEKKQTEELLLRSEKLASIGTLSAGVAHEILNPLNIIGTIAQIMMMDHKKGPVHDNLDEILTQIRRATKITSGLKLFAHQRAEKIEPIDINETVEQALSLVEFDMKLQNITVKRDLQSDLPPVEADKDKLMQVFINLITNARDALQGNKQGVLTISTWGGTDGVDIRFADNGPGIPAQHLNRIFDPFFTTKDPGKGTGLGLAVVHSIIQNHGGTIVAESAEGVGASFHIYLPLKARGGKTAPAEH